MNIAERFQRELGSCTTKEQTDTALDRLWDTYLFRWGNPDDAYFFFADHSGLLMRSFDGSDHQMTHVFLWAEKGTIQ